MSIKPTKPFILAIAAFLLVIASNAQTQVLNGTYAGNAAGEDHNGRQIHQIAKFTFANTRLMNFTEVETFWLGVGYTACLFNPEFRLPPGGSYPVNFNTPDVSYIPMLSYYCPDPGANRQPEVLEIFPDSGGAGFSYIEHTSPGAVVNDENVPAASPGHAVRQ